MISFTRILIPFSSRNFVVRTSFSYFGYTEYFIFGIRIAQIQKTEPWTE